MRYDQPISLTAYRSIPDALDALSELTGYELQFSDESILILNDDTFIREIKHRMVQSYENETGTKPMFRKKAVYETIYDFNFFFYSLKLKRQFISFKKDTWLEQHNTESYHKEFDELVDFEGLYSQLEELVAKLQQTIDDDRLLWETVVSQFCHGYGNNSPQTTPKR